jgi:O-antigen ligase
MSAHNDYLHIIMDHGIVGLIAIATMIAGLWSRVFVEGRAVLIAMLINSFFSNGFFQSPLLAMLLALVLSVSMLATLNPVVVEPSHPAPPD